MIRKMTMTMPMRVSPSEYYPTQLPKAQPSPPLYPSPSLSKPSASLPAFLPFSCSSGGWPTSGLNPPLRSLIPDLPLHPMDELPGGPTPITPVIKAGWLDKNPPQG
jgi:hypothetical protein